MTDNFTGLDTFQPDFPLIEANILCARNCLLVAGAIELKVGKHKVSKPLVFQLDLRLRGPHGQFIAVGINEVEPASTGERKNFAGDHRAQSLEPLLRVCQIVRIQDD